MKRILLVVVLFSFMVLPLFASFCNQCGTRNPDEAKFCSQCGAAMKKPAKDSVKPTTDKTTKPEPQKEKAAEPAVKTTPEGAFRTKTDLYVYDKRGDEHNVLKKNFLFKPRRYKIPANYQVKILETVGDTLKVQSLPDAGGKVFEGWVTDEEFGLRTDWKKP